MRYLESAPLNCEYRYNFNSIMLTIKFFKIPNLQKSSGSRS